MNSVDMESEELSDDEDDEDYIPDQEECDEESNVREDDTVRNYDDDEGVDDDNDDYEPVGNVSIDVNEVNNVGHPTGTPGEAMPDENPRVEDNRNEKEEQEDHDFVGSEVEDGENPGVEDNENEGVQQENYDVDSVAEEQGEKVMYMEVLKALYGTLRAAQLFGGKLQAKLVNDWGFVPNRYDSCVVNKKVDGKQLTVAWHVDDLKVSHEKEEVLDEFIGMMGKEFGQDTPLSLSRGLVQEYLGMTLDFSERGRVVVKMSNYVKNILNDAPASMDGKAATRTAAYLFKVNTENPKLLGKDKKEVFVHLVMQGLYLSQRGRPNIRTAVSFLCSPLTCPDEDDYKKLTSLIWYL